jgi:hypothetical protein
MRGNQNELSLLGGGSGADRRGAAGWCAAASLRVLGTLGMVAMLTMTAGKAAGRVLEWNDDPDSENGDCNISIQYECPPKAQISLPMPTAGTGGVDPLPGCGIYNSHKSWRPMPFGKSWLEDTATLTSRRLDRTPAAAIMFPDNGEFKWSPFNNPEGLRGWWRAEGQAQDGGPRPDVPIDDNQNNTPDQFDALIWQLEKLYVDFGVRRFILWVPAGSYFGRQRLLFNDPSQYVFMGQDLPANQWYSMPAWKRDQFSNPTGAFQTWRAAHPSVKFDLYMGTPLMEDACTLHCFPKAET